jgi:hypothetical protein
MKAWAAILLAANLAASGGGQEPKKDEDRIGKDKAPTVAKKALNEVGKKKNAAITEATSSATGPQPAVAGSFEGVMKKELSAMKGAVELYAKGSVVLVNTGGRYDSPEELQGPEATQAQSFKNPSLVLGEAARVTASATYGPDEAVEGKECRTVELLADEALIKQHLKEIGDRLDKTFRGAGGGGAFGPGGLFKFSSALDEKATVATYHLCVGKDDLLVYRVLFVIKPKFKPNAFPPPFRMPPNLELEQRVDIKFSKWDEDLPLDLPAAIKAKWGIK